MIYRTLDANGDYVIGRTLVDSPEAVAQAVKTRLLLWQGEWFLDITDGTPYMQGILGHNRNYDFAIKARILNTPGVTEITSYSSGISPNRALSVTCTINTAYGPATVSLPQ
jgi:hypothetical protein